MRAGRQAGEGTGSLGPSGAQCRLPQRRPRVGSPAGLNSGPHAACPSALTWDHAVGGDRTHGDGSQHCLQRHRRSSQKRGHFGATPGPITDGLSHRQEDGLQDAQGYPCSPPRLPKLSSYRTPKSTSLGTPPGIKAGHLSATSTGDRVWALWGMGSLSACLPPWGTWGTPSGCPLPGSAWGTPSEHLLWTTDAERPELSRGAASSSQPGSGSSPTTGWWAVCNRRAGRTASGKLRASVVTAVLPDAALARGPRGRACSLKKSLVFPPLFSVLWQFLQTRPEYCQGMQLRRPHPRRRPVELQGGGSWGLNPWAEPSRGRLEDEVRSPQRERGSRAWDVREPRPTQERWGGRGGEPVPGPRVGRAGGAGAGVSGDSHRCSTWRR